MAQDDRELTVRPRTASSTQAIEGGTLDSGDPNVVAIMINAGGGIAICSGSLIAPNLVLSAHHCVADVGSASSCSTNSFGTQYSAGSFRVTTSATSAYNYFNQGSMPPADNQTWFSVRQVWVPGNNICGEDMSLLELSSNINNVTPIVPRVDSPVGQGEAYTAVGFGITSPSSQAAGKRYTVSGLNVTCSGNCGYGMGSGEWEGGTQAAKGTCEGDSGGPALDAQGRVIGTVSRGPANACNDTVYESVYDQASWIKSKAQQAATDGQYTAPVWVGGGSTGTGGGAGGGSGSTGGGSGSTGGGSGSTGGGSGSSGGSCADPSLQCVDASGQGDYACVDPQGGFPTNAQSCQKDSDCPNGYNCWSDGQTSACLQACGSSAAGGGAGGGSQSGTGGGSQSGAGGGSQSNTGGGSQSNTGGGSQSGTGGGSQSGTGGGNSQSGTGGGNSQSGTGGGNAQSGTGGGNSQSGTGGSGSITQTGMGSGCSASGSTMPAFAAFALLALLKRRRVAVSSRAS